MLDAAKDEMGKKKAPPKKDQAKEDGGEPKEQQGGMKAQDGIPANAQLKALRAEQADIYERTQQLAKANPDAGNLNDAQRRELTELHNDQNRILELFQQITAPAEKKGEQP